jgi:predicted O-methyltransferase YrrM
VEPHLLAAARAAPGFMPDDEGLALYEAGREAGRLGPLLEIGTYCGKSAIYLGTAAREAGTVLFTVDHHRGSEENQAGWEHHDDRLVDPRTGRMDTLPFFRRTIDEAGLEDTVVAVIGSSPTVAAHWATPLGLVFVDGGHAFDVALADYDGWARFLVPGGLLVFHDVFEDPAEGGQAPFEVWQQAVASGDFIPRSTTGSLRVLTRRGRGGSGSAVLGGALFRDGGARRDELGGTQPLGEALAAEQPGARSFAAERLRGQHDRG